MESPSSAITNQLIVPLDDLLFASHQTKNQWMEGNYSFDLFAPDPDLFDTEIEANADDLSALDVASLHDTLAPLQHPSFYGNYRNGPASTITASSESQSGYEFENTSFYSSHSGYHTVDPLASFYAASLANANAAAAANNIINTPQSADAGIQSTQPYASAAAAADLALDFSDFNLSVLGSLPLGTNDSTAAQSASALPAAGGPQLPTTIDTSVLDIFLNPPAHLNLAHSLSTNPSLDLPYTPVSATSSAYTPSPPISALLSQQEQQQLLESMYFLRRGDPLPVPTPNQARSSQQQQLPQAQNGRRQQQQQQQKESRGPKREATSSPAIPAPDFVGIERQMPAGTHSRPGKRLAVSSALGSEDEDDGHVGLGSGSGSKRYKCPNCDRAFARAYNLKTHLATHDPNRVKSFVCRHAGCGRSFSRKHDLGRHYTSIHGTTAPGPSALSAASASHRAKLSRKDKDQDQDQERDIDNEHEQQHEPEHVGDRGDDSGASSSTESVGTAASGSAYYGTSGARVGGGEGPKRKLHCERVWCDGCGRGWIKGESEACQCDEVPDAGAGTRSAAKGK